MIQQILALAPHVYDLRMASLVIPYPGLDFIAPYSVGLINLLIGVSLAGAAGLALGLLPRLTALVFTVSFTYLYLIDLSFYNNHYYLWSLLGILFMVVDTQNSYSIIDFFRKDFSKRVSSMAVQSFKLLVSIVYLYAAVVKVNADWMSGYPLIMKFEAMGLAGSEWIGLGMSYGGLLFDFFMAFGLWFLAKKWYVALFYIGFHISNSFLFPIGMFPFVMIAAWLLFAAPVKSLKTTYREILAGTLIQKARLVTIGLFLLFNFVFPLRYLMYEGRTSWHRQGYLFSWRMMLDRYELKDFKFYVNLPENEISYFVDFNQFITPRQYLKSFYDAYAIWYMAQKLELDAIQKYGESDPQVFNIATVQLNQHEPKNIYNPDLDLTKHKYRPFDDNKFINL